VLDTRECNIDMRLSKNPKTLIFDFATTWFNYT